MALSEGGSALLPSTSDQEMRQNPSGDVAVPLESEWVQRGENEVNENGMSMEASVSAAVESEEGRGISGDKTEGRPEGREMEEGGGGTGGTEGSEEDEGRVDEDLEFEKGFKMVRVCDKLIEVFWIDRPDPEEWRKLLAYSEEWAKIRPHFFKRIKERAAAMEDPKKRETLFRLARRLKEVDDDMERHNELLRYIEANEDINAVISRRRKDFTGAFFEHLQTLCNANVKNPERRDELAALAAKCVTALNAYDEAMEDQVAMVGAEEKFSEILQSPSLEEACRKIDDLAEKNQLDSALMLLITKAWAASKESNMMKEEVKDVMYHLYMQARGNLQRLIPTEVRIIRHLITLEDPREQFASLVAAFSPGDDQQGPEIDYLYTTPQDLHKWVKHVLDAYYSNKEGTLIQEAQKMMNPNVIIKLEILKDVIQKEFL